MLVALLAVAGLRLWRLPGVLPDYHSVTNWQTVLALVSGNLSVLFSPSGPGFNLLFVPVAWVTPMWWQGAWWRVALFWPFHTWRWEP